VLSRYRSKLTHYRAACISFATRTPRTGSYSWPMKRQRRILFIISYNNPSFRARASRGLFNDQLQATPPDCPSRPSRKIIPLFLIEGEIPRRFAWEFSIRELKASMNLAARIRHPPCCRKSVLRMQRCSYPLWRPSRARDGYSFVAPRRRTTYDSNIGR